MHQVNAETRTEYVPEFGRSVRIAEIDRPMMSDDVETAQTVTLMDELAARDSNERSVIAAVAEALDQAGIGYDATPTEKACAVYWWLKRTIRYVPTPGTSPLVDQTLITPCAVLAMPEPIGDCPQFSMLAAAMFRVLCMDSMFVTIAAEPKARNQWSHIYNTVEVFPGQYMPFDSSNGPAPGAEYAKPFKRRVWPRIVAGKCRTKEGSKDMVRSFTGKPRAGMRNSALRGTLGDGDDYSIYEGDPDLGIPAVAPIDYNSFDSSLEQSSYNLANPNTINASMGVPGSSGGGSLWSTLLNDATSLAAPIIKNATQQQPYYVTGPNGQAVLYNPNTGGVVGATASLGSISPTVLLIGIGALALFAFSGKK